MLINNKKLGKQYNFVQEFLKAEKKLKKENKKKNKARE